jgi:hypothetical protein
MTAKQWRNANLGAKGLHDINAITIEDAGT